VKWWRRGGGVAAFGVVMLLPGCVSAAPAPEGTAVSGGAGTPDTTGAYGKGLGRDEIGHSANVTFVANVPFGRPFDGPETTGTDMAFQGDYAFVGNYEGFTVHDISDPARPKVTARVACPGGQNDISVMGDLLFLSVDEPRADAACGSGRGDEQTGWEGIRVFDISDVAHPRYVKAVATACGSHTHTLVPGKGAGNEKVYVSVSACGPGPDAVHCRPPHDSISIVEVPLGDPARARVVAEPVLFPDGGYIGGGGRASTTGCHDITVYPEKDLAAGACMGNGLLMDISDPVRPRVLQEVTDTAAFSIWHSATFSNDATKVVFGDELGSGVSPTCDARTPRTQGTDAVYEITPDRRLVRHGHFKIPRDQTPSENCVAHNGSLMPVPGRDIMVQAWYQGGVSVIDFTDADHPVEIGYFERGPLGDHLLGGSWSAYYYNGYIYSSDIMKGLDVLRIDDPRTDPAGKVRMKRLNAQTQVSYPEN
jgi:hypothetical protein